MKRISLAVFSLAFATLAAAESPGLAPAGASAPLAPRASSHIGAAPVSPSSATAKIPVDWKELKSDRGWSIRYPKDWDVYVFSEDNVNPTAQAGRSVNFSGPKGCFEKGNSCGLLRIALTDDAAFVKPPAGTPTRTFGVATGKELAPGSGIFPYDDEVGTLTFGLSGQPHPDAPDVDRTMTMMLNSLTFENPWAVSKRDE